MDNLTCIMPDERLDSINDNLRLIQKTDGLTFGTDAYLLAAFARSDPSGVMVDLGSGTGVASLLCMARQKFRTAFAVELQDDFVDLIRRNVLLNGLENSVRVIGCDVRDLTQNTIGSHVSTVISNPPYMRTNGGFANANTRMDIARREVFGTIADFCAAASRLLHSGGTFYTVYRADRMPELISALRSVRLEPKRMVTVYSDLDSRPSLILIASKKDGAPELIQSPPLIIYRSPSDRTYTSNMQRIYDTFSLEFLFQNEKRGSNQ